MDRKRLKVDELRQTTVEADKPYQTDRHDEDEKKKMAAAELLVKAESESAGANAVPGEAAPIGEGKAEP